MYLIVIIYKFIHHKFFVLKKYIIFLIVYFVLLSLNAQDQNLKQALKFFDQKQFTLAQSLFEEEDGETALFYNARCAQELNLENAEDLFVQLLDEYPFSIYYNEAYLALYQINFTQENYTKAIDFLLKLNELNNKQRFDLAYSYFQIDSLDLAKLNFSKLLQIESDYQSASKYYFAHISYQSQNYQSSLRWFKELINDKKFKHIVPYYIAQIYYYLNEYEQLIDFLYPIIDNVVESRKLEANRLLGGAFYRQKNYLNAVKFLKVYSDLSDNVKDLENFMLGFSYYQISDYLLAVEYLNKVKIEDNRQGQITSYYLGASYLRLNKNNYALQGFKKASKMDFDKQIKEESLFNYAKLAYELDLPFENTLSIFQEFSLSATTIDKKEHIKSLSVSVLKGTSNYLDAYNSLMGKRQLSFEEKIMLQELTFFIGIQEFNNKNFQSSIKYFKESIQAAENDKLMSAAKIWLADAYFQTQEFELAKDIYSQSLIVGDSFLTSLKLYNEAYTLFQLNEFKESAIVFRTYIKDDIDSMFLNDSYLRIADCYYMTKDFVLAEKYYEKSISLNLFDIDYALFQRSLCMSLLNNNSKKVQLLNRLVTDYKNSIYLDDALFLLAEHLKNSNKFDDAIGYYDDVIKTTTVDDLKAKSNLGKAMIYFNNDDIQNAIDQYKLIIEKFQNTSSFKEALIGLKSIYVGIAKVDEYISFINTIPQYKISLSEQDSLSYSAAFIKFSEQDYMTSSIAFKKYIDEFNQGIFLFDAYNYLAYSHLYMGDSIEPIKYFKYLVDNNVNQYLEDALIHLSRVYFKQQDYNTSNIYYTALEKIASSNSLKREALIRLMYGHEKGNKKQAMNYALKVLDLDKIDDWLISKAKLIISRYDFELGNYNKAKTLFEQIVKIDNNSEGAEAMYNLIYLSYLDDSLDLCEDLIFEMPEKFSDDYFIAKSFILLSDIYLKKENKFQAKATLESIIENYSGEDLKLIAQKKREEIIESELTINKNEEIEIFYMDIFEDDLEYENINDTTINYE